MTLKLTRLSKREVAGVLKKDVSAMTGPGDVRYSLVTGSEDGKIYLKELLDPYVDLPVIITVEVFRMQVD